VGRSRSETILLQGQLWLKRSRVCMCVTKWKYLHKLLLQGQQLVLHGAVKPLSFLLLLLIPGGFRVLHDVACNCV
jgi:hypothetical protein